MEYQSVYTILFLVIIILIISLSWLSWQYMKLRRAIFTEEGKEPAGNAKNSELEAQLKERDDAFKVLNPVVKRFIILLDGISDVAEKPTAKDRLEALHKLLETAKVWDKNLKESDGIIQLGKVLNEATSLTEKAEQFMPVIKLLQGKIQQFYGQLRIVELDESTKRQIRSDFLSLSMMMIDVLESIDNLNYIEEHQGINVRLLKAELTPEEALSMTSPVTYLDIETSLWAQKLYKSIEKWAGTKDEPLIEERPYLLNGMRFEFNNQQ